MLCRFVPCLLAGLLAGPMPGQRVVEAAEPNDSLATATVLPCGREAVGTLQTFVDDDWYRLDLTTATDLWLATGPTVTGEIGDTVLTLLDATGGPLRGNLDGVGRGRYSQLYVADLAAGIYFVSVARGASGALSGGYVLDVRCASPMAIAAPPIVGETGGNNDVLSGGTAQNVSLPVRCSGTLSSTGFDGDWDFYRVLLLSDGVLRIRTAATVGHPSAGLADDPVVYLFDAATPAGVLAGPLRASAKNAWDQAFDVPLAGGFYRVAVRGLEGSAAGSYYLDLSTVPAARVTVHPGGCGGRALGLATTALGGGGPQSVERPQTGTTYSLEGQNLDSGGFAFHVVGFAATSVGLGAFGAVGCTLEVVNVDAVFQLADAAGRATWPIAIPEVPGLLGTTIESQAAVFDLSNPLGITISNRVTSVVGS